MNSVYRWAAIFIDKVLNSFVIVGIQISAISGLYCLTAPLTAECINNLCIDHNMKMVVRLHIFWGCQMDMLRVWFEHIFMSIHHQVHIFISNNCLNRIHDCAGEICRKMSMQRGMKRTGQIIELQINWNVPQKCIGRVRHIALWYWLQRTKKYDQFTLTNEVRIRVFRFRLTFSCT